MIFLPYSDFTRSTLALDPIILRDQADSILSVLDHLHNDADESYVNLTLIQLWRGYEPQLCQLGLLTTEALLAQGCNCDPEYLDKFKWHLSNATSGEYTLDKPSWIGDERVHRSHRSVLRRIDHDFYSKRFPEEGVLPLFWPGHLE